MRGDTDKNLNDLLFLVAVVLGMIAVYKVR